MIHSCSSENSAWKFCSGKFLSLIVCSLSLYCSLVISADKVESTPNKRPNFLLIVADDLGYSDLGAFGGEIETPNLDKLANHGGAKFTNFHVAPTCSPTRSMLMSGTYNHKAGLGAMAEWVADNQKDQPGYEGYLNNKVVSLPTLLQDAGYNTFMAGKWHLGMKPGQGPENQGFDHSFVMLPGAGNHYSDRGLVPFLPVVPYRENGKKVKLPKGFYSTDFYTDKTIEYINDSVASSEQPFFAYVAYTSPHWPLQVDRKYSDKYKGKYDSGYANIKETRFKKMVQLGLVNDSVVPSPKSVCYPDWQQLSESEQMRQARMMEIYAGMVDSLDDNIGRLIRHLKDIGEFENTFIVFMSDNGADARPERGLNPKSEYMRKNYDNSLANMGNENSFVSYGGAWAEVGSTPLKLHKGMTTEGGIRAPAIIHFPNGKYKSGIQKEFVSVMDILPTFLDLANISHPGSSYKGREIHPVSGRSIVPYLQGKEEAVHKDHAFGFSVHRRQGLQYNNWKIVRLPAPYGNNEWTLYDLEVDPSERNNLANHQPKVMKKMIQRWEDFATQTGVIVSAPDAVSPGECLLQ